MSVFNPGWYLIYTRPRHERKVADQLAAASNAHFLPLVKSLRNWSDRRKYVDAPLFPSYVFVKLENSAEYFNCLSLNGVLYFVRHGKDVAKVDESVIRNLQMIVAEPEAEIMVSTERFAPGEKQLVCDGPFAGFNCEIIRHNGKRKALVRIDIIQRNLVVDMPLENLLPAAEALRAYSGDTN